MKELVRILLVVMSALGASLLAHGDEQMVFIHGYDSGPEVWDTMVGLMDEWGYSRENVTVCDYQSQSKNTSIEDLASSVYWESIDPLLRVGKTELLFVVHSMGGLLLRSMVDQGLLSEDYVESVVSLAVPHYGAALPGVDMQTRQMKRGSSFIWNLANTKRKIQPSKVLSVSCGTQDEVVDY